MGKVPVIIINGARGRMGSTLVSLAKKDPGLDLVAVMERPGFEHGLETIGVEVATDAAALLPNHQGAVVVDFTAPASSVELARVAAENKVAVVIGTTGLNAKEVSELEKYAQETPIFWSPNMSVGVNVLLKILPDLVNYLGDAYDVELSETHHKMKKDAPSGTALKLAQVLADAKDWAYDEVKKHCRDGIIGERPTKQIGVQTLRGGDVVGDHTVFFFGPGERIEVTHRAHSRDTFASGALRVAKWLADQKPGKLYTMADIF